MKQLLIIFFFLLGYFSYAQNNLVPNWSFENISTCPTGTIYTTTLPFANPWQNPTQSTPDLFSSCDTFIPPFELCPVNGTPCNAVGYQIPHSGNNYAGFFEYSLHISPENYREYIQVSLISKLVTNKKYCVSFYASLAERSAYATSRLGAFISTNAVSSISDTTIQVVPQIEPTFNNYIRDTVLWTEIKGIYTAGGGENYITIGNFYSYSNTDTLYIGGRNPFEQDIYYYIDDVSLTEYNTANAGRDTSICKGFYASLGNYQNSFGAMYNWSVLNGDSSSLATQYDTTSHAWGNPKKTTTYVLQKQQCGIFSYDTITVKIPASYTANAGRDTSLCIGDTAVIGVNNCSWCNYTWQNINANAPVLSVSPLATTTYTLHLKDSCNTTNSLVTIRIDYCQSPVITIPNIFTPNSDDINDSWQPIIQNQLSMLNYQCTIYDRWGIKVFETTNNATGFDGHTTSGIAASTGTYFYVLSYTDAKANETKTLKGFLELVR